jgi:hypothetical protein
VGPSPGSGEFPRLSAKALEEVPRMLLNHATDDANID